METKRKAEMKAKERRGREDYFRALTVSGTAP
jgi:hypothetical protein